VLYQPTVMPFFTYRFGGLVAALGFVFYNMWIRPVNDTIGGYYNAVADHYLMTDRLKLAEGYYKIATRYAYFNHHSNYLLAGIEAQKGNAGRYKKYLSDATGRRPIPQTYINLGDLMLADQRTLDAYTYFKSGLDRFPDDAYLLNAMGVANHLLGSEDSAQHFLEVAVRQGGTAGTAANRNRFAVLAKLQRSIDPDSLWKAAEDPSAQSNAAAFASRNKYHLPVGIPLPADSILDDASATLLNNMLVNHMDSLPEADINRFTQLINRKENSPFAESLLVALSHAAYRQGMATDAFQLAERALFTTENKGRYNNLLAIWALDQGSPETAIRYSDFAVQQGYPDALLTRAVILAEAGRKAEAAIAWDSLAKGKNNLVTMMSDLSKRALLLDVTFLGKLSDQERYAYCRYHIDALDSVTFRKATSLITNDDLRARAIYDRAERLYRNDHLKSAIGTYAMLEGIPLSDEELYHDIRMLELLMLASRREYSSMAKQINNNFRFRRTEEPQKRYFTALLSLSDTAKAGSNLRWIGAHNLFFEDGIIALAAYHQQSGASRLKDYDLLARALHVNPTSIKILKAFIRSTVRLEMEMYNQQAFADLQRLIGPAEYARFLRSLPPPEKSE
ncbi:MAG: tetratricopeptide repeat protein, partial [Bacteroidota bacterium]